MQQKENNTNEQANDPWNLFAFGGPICAASLRGPIPKLGPSHDRKESMKYFITNGLLKFEVVDKTGIANPVGSLEPLDAPG